MMPQPPKPGQPNPQVERSGTLIEPGANLSARQPAGQQPVERSGTLIETDDDIRQALLSGHKGRQPGPAVAVEPSAPIRGTVTRRGAFRRAVSPDGAAAGGRADGV